MALRKTKREIDKENKRLQTNRARPSERGRHGDEIAKIKTRAAGVAQRLKASIPKRQVAGAEASVGRKLVRQQKATDAKVATAAAVKYTRPTGLNYSGPKFKKRTPAERAKIIAARKKKQLQG